MLDPEEIDSYAAAVVADCRSLAHDEICRAILLRCRELLEQGLDFELVLEVERSAMEQLGIDSRYFFGRPESARLEVTPRSTRDRLGRPGRAR